MATERKCYDEQRFNVSRHQKQRTSATAEPEGTKNEPTDSNLFSKIGKRDA